MKKLKVAIIGLAHAHANILYSDFNRYEDKIEWLGCADVLRYKLEGTNGVKERMAENLHSVKTLKVYENYIDLLDEKPDIALVCTENIRHVDVVEELMKRRICTVVEKPMAVNLDEGRRMYRTAKAYDTTLAINWPITWHAAYRLAYDLIQKGAIGKPLRFHYRNPDSCGPYSHGGGEFSNEFLSTRWWYQREQGGGSMLDYCGYGCTMATWFLGGMAVSATGTRANMISPYADVEDYSTMTVCFSDTIALLEGSWSTISGGGIPTGPVIFGTEGTLVTDRYSNTVKIYKTLHGENPDEVYEAPEMQADIALEIINHLTKGTPIHPTLDLDINMKSLAALDAGVRSCKSGKMEQVKNPFWVE